MANATQHHIPNLKSRPQLGTPGKSSPAVFAFYDPRPQLELHHRYLYQKSPPSYDLEGLTDNVWSQSIASA
jgi:hypothetical protein